MTDLAAPMNMKRKDVEVVASHGFSIFLEPKRIKLQLQDGKILDMMEEDEPLAHAPTATATAPIIVHEKVNIVSVGISSETTSRLSEDQGAAAEAPMDVENRGPAAPSKPECSLLFRFLLTSEWQSTEWKIDWNHVRS